MSTRKKRKIKVEEDSKPAVVREIVSKSEPLDDVVQLRSVAVKAESSVIAQDSGNMALKMFVGAHVSAAGKVGVAEFYLKVNVACRLHLRIPYLIVNTVILFVNQVVCTML